MGLKRGPDANATVVAPASRSFFLELTGREAAMRRRASRAGKMGIAMPGRMLLTLTALLGIFMGATADVEGAAALAVFPSIRILKCGTLSHREERDEVRSSRKAALEPRESRQRLP